MSATTSALLDLGTRAPSFSLSDPDGRVYSLDDFDNYQALLVIFMCNHCPYVKHIIDSLVEIATQFRPWGIGFVGINSNDTAAYPEDSPEKMAEFVRKHSIPFPYLFDETQQVARAFQAVCTPDFFLFDEARKLVYHGQLDDSRPGNDLPLTGRDLCAALDALLNNQPVPGEQKPSIGCSIKWK